MQHQAQLAADAAASVALELHQEVLLLRERLVRSQPAHRCDEAAVCTRIMIIATFFTTITTITIIIQNEEIRSRRNVEQHLHDAVSASATLRGQLRAAHQAADAGGALTSRRGPQVPVSKLRLQADDLQRRLVHGVALLEQDADVLAAHVSAAQQAAQEGVAGAASGV